MQTDIDCFSDNDLRRIFKNYCGYKHLLLNPTEKLSNEHMRKSLREYFNYFNEIKDDERGDIVRDFLEDHDVEKFKSSLIGDQFMEEPLMHICNKLRIV